MKSWAMYNPSMTFFASMGTVFVLYFGGQQVFYAIHHLYLTSGGMYLLVFDLSLMLKQMEEEMRVINFWLNSVELHAPDAAIIMIGTRCNQVKDEDLEKIDDELTKIIIIYL